MNVGWLQSERCDVRPSRDAWGGAHEKSMLTGFTSPEATLVIHWHKICGGFSSMTSSTQISHLSGWGLAAIFCSCILGAWSGVRAPVPHETLQGCPANRPRGVTVSTLDSESSDRGSNPREAFCDRRHNEGFLKACHI